jgi:hypothetical protein
MTVLHGNHSGCTRGPGLIAVMLATNSDVSRIHPSPDANRRLSAPGRGFRRTNCVGPAAIDESPPPRESTPDVRGRVWTAA